MAAFFFHEVQFLAQLYLGVLHLFAVAGFLQFNLLNFRVQVQDLFLCLGMLSLPQLLHSRDVSLHSLNLNFKINHLVLKLSLLLLRVKLPRVNISLDLALLIFEFSARLPLQVLHLFLLLLQLLPFELQLQAAFTHR